MNKVLKAAKKYKTNKIVITGGVSANSRLRARSVEMKDKGYQIVIPPLRYCTDNAAMIGYTGIQYLNNGHSDQLKMGPSTQVAAEFKTVEFKRDI